MAWLAKCHKMLEWCKSIVVSFLSFSVGFEDFILTCACKFFQLVRNRSWFIVNVAMYVNTATGLLN